MTETIHDTREPVRRIATDTDAPPVGTAICLSGGGFRAMLFHAGVLWRLCETGWLWQVDRVSSVSGGAMTAAALAQVWRPLQSADDPRSAYEELVVQKVRTLASHTIDRPSVIRGALSPFTTIGEEVEDALKRYLLDETMLSSLPTTPPKFIFNATNIGSGALVRFSRSELADWRVGRILHPSLPLSTAVAAASAFPPFLSPYRLDLTGQTWEPSDDNDLGTPDYRDEFALTDGGVYDNLGLETAWKRCRTLFVSDAGGILSPEPDPAGDWARHIVRITHVLDHQVRSLRKRQVIDSFKAHDREGVYVGIRSDITKYKAPDCLPAPYSATIVLADIKTRLKKLSDSDQKRLINWGYAIADAGLRSFIDHDATPPPAYPYPGGVT